MPEVPDQIFTLDYVDVVRGREADYMASSHSLVAAHGQSILADTGVMQFQATEVAGEWPCVVNVWERSWQTWVNTVAGRFTDGSRNVAVEEWWQANTAVRTGGLDLVLTGSPATAPLVEAAQTVAHCPAFLIDTVHIRSAAVEDFLAAADSDLAREATDLGGALVGAYRTLWRPNVAVTIVGMPSVGAIDALVTAKSGGRWARHRESVLIDADCRIMLPARSNAGRADRT